jgi:DeoR/GlpR family transcriptional regulator of sugar metabolism
MGSGAERGPVARRELVRQRVLAEGFARLDDLARQFDVSLMTMHRDVDALEADGWLTKIRGGATANPSALVDVGVRERRAALRAEKDAICALAAGLLRHGQMIFLDDSTTALGLVPWLAEHTPLTVATNFLPVVSELEGVEGVELHLLGGQYHPKSQACFGLQTIAAISRLRADLFFMSTTAVIDGKCLHRSEETVAVRRAFMDNAGRRILLVDHAKIGRQAAHMLCRIDEFDIVITDDKIDPQDLDDLRARCANVQVAATAL